MVNGNCESAVRDMHAFFRRWGAQAYPFDGRTPVLNYCMPVHGQKREISIMLGDLPHGFRVGVLVRKDTTPRQRNRLRASPHMGHVTGFLVSVSNAADVCEGLELFYPWGLPLTDTPDGKPHTIDEALTFTMKFATRDLIIVENILDFENLADAPGIWVEH